MYRYIIYEIIGWLIILLVVLLAVLRIGLFKKIKFLFAKRNFARVFILGITAIIFGAGFVLLGKTAKPLHFAMPATLHSHTPDQNPPSLPLVSLFRFITQSNNFERVSNIGVDPNAVPKKLNRNQAADVHIKLVAKEVISEVYPGIFNNYWTFDGQVPGPMYRVRVGDTVHVSLTNHKTSLHNHNIDFHAATGPGGGAKVSNVAPGETKEFTWKALSPGLYVYHCATSNVSVHNSHGQYGMILVEPEDGLSEVDKEFYVMQGELYTQGGIGRKGLLAFDPQALLDGHPTYVTFNGMIEQKPRMHAKVGEKIRMYVGNGGVNLVSSFHIIGEIFDRVYPEASMGSNSAIFENVQTTAVLPGGATIVEFTVNVPGEYLLVDHALSRMNKGAWAVLKVGGPDNPEIFSGEQTKTDSTTNH